MGENLLDRVLAQPPRDDGKILGAGIDGVFGEPSNNTDATAAAIHERATKAAAEELVRSGKLKPSDVDPTPSKKLG